MDQLTAETTKVLFEQMAQAIANERWQLATQLWIYCSSLPISYVQQIKLQNLSQKIISSRGVSYSNKPPLRIAILGNLTLMQLKSSLKAGLEVRGHKVELYESSFDSLEQDVLNSESGLYAFDPTHVLFWAMDEDIPADATTEDFQTFASRQSQLWNVLKKGLPKVQIIQTTIAIPNIRAFGHVETRTSFSRNSQLAGVNARLLSEAPASISIMDLDHLASAFGKTRWFDRRFWYHSKHAFAIDATAFVGNEITRIIQAGLGQSYKCLVLDLDNTLWGGVIGDDGLSGIELGETPDGEAFVAFQTYVKSLKNRGVILAVCSKNFEAIAKTPFLEHSQMVLKESDIACFVANWDNKADNIRLIAQSLEIGLDSIVFFDDNPAERMLVREKLPEVFTVEAPKDPSDYVWALDSLGLFDLIQVTDGDLQRANQYRDNNLRKAHAKTITSLDDYLADLQMKGVIEIVTVEDFKRPLQLLNKSNQFNLMTNRYTPGEFEALLSLPTTLAFSLKLIDRFGDNGIIAVLICEQKMHELEIRDWVMSCRVLNRGMEQFTFNALLKAAKKMGLQKIVGTYKATPKNSLVCNLLPNLGFSLVDDTVESKRYVIDTSAQEIKNFIHNNSPTCF